MFANICTTITFMCPYKYTSFIFIYSRGSLWSHSSMNHYASVNYKLYLIRKNYDFIKLNNIVYIIILIWDLIIWYCCVKSLHSTNNKTPINLCQGLLVTFCPVLFSFPILSSLCNSPSSSYLLISLAIQGFVCHCSILYVVLRWLSSAIAWGHLVFVLLAFTSFFT